MFQHLLVALLRVLRLVDAYNLNLRELMQTVQTTYVLTIRASLTTEALCVCTVLDRKILLVENHVAVNIRNGHLGCWDEIEIIYLTVVHLTFFIW